MLIRALLHPFDLGSFQPMKYNFEETTLIRILLIRCMLYAAAFISLQFTKNIQMYQYFFYDYHLVYILATVRDASTSISNSAVFLHTVLDSLKQRRLDFRSPK